MDGSDRLGQVCPPVVEYTTTDQARAVEEVEMLPEGALIVSWLADYSVLREQASACRQGRFVSS